MARAFGLPGSRGNKAHEYYVLGNAHGWNGWGQRNTSSMSKACAKAYQRGYEAGVEQKKAHKELEGRGAVYGRHEDRFGDKKMGWWLDGQYLGRTVKIANEAIQEG